MEVKRIFQLKEQQMQRHEEGIQLTVGWGEVEGEARHVEPVHKRSCDLRISKSIINHQVIFSKEVSKKAPKTYSVGKKNR